MWLLLRALARCLRRLTVLLALVLATCHDDVEAPLAPDWTFDTAGCCVRAYKAAADAVAAEGKPTDVAPLSARAPAAAGVALRGGRQRRGRRALPWLRVCWREAVATPAPHEQRHQSAAGRTHARRAKARTCE